MMINKSRLIYSVNAGVRTPVAQNTSCHLNATIKYLIGTSEFPRETWISSDLSWLSASDFLDLQRSNNTFGGTQEQHIWWHNHFGIGYNIFGGTQEWHLWTAGVIYWMGHSDIASQFLKLSGVHSYEFGMLAIF